MAYYFAVETESIYVGKNIKASGFFDAKPTYSDYCSCTLEEIDDYTTKYTSERQLKNSLLSERIIKEEDLERNIAIMHLNDNAIALGVILSARLVPGKILYKDSECFIKNPNLVINYITKKILEKDNIFFRDLKKSLTEDLELKALVYKIEIIIDNMIVNETNKINEKVENIIKSFIYTSKTNEDKLTNTCKINYENLHTIVSFISEYEKSLIKENNYTKTRKNTLI